VSPARPGLPQPSLSSTGDDRMVADAAVIENEGAAMLDVVQKRLALIDPLRSAAKLAR
jgi:hypothetical protein